MYTQFSHAPGFNLMLDTGRHQRAFGLFRLIEGKITKLWTAYWFSIFPIEITGMWAARRLWFAMFVFYRRRLCDHCLLLFARLTTVLRESWVSNCVASDFMWLLVKHNGWSTMSIVFALTASLSELHVIASPFIISAHWKLQDSDVHAFCVDTSGTCTFKPSFTCQELHILIPWVVN